MKRVWLPKQDVNNAITNRVIIEKGSLMGLPPID